MIQHTLRQARAVTEAFRHEHWSPEAVSRLQDHKLRAMIRHVWNHSDFYRQRFQAAGVTPEEIRTVADLAKLPVLTKEELRSVGSEALLTQGYTPENTVLETTSGSTGKRIPLYHDRQAWEAYHALVLRHLWGIGYRPWHRLAYLSFDAAPKPPWVQMGIGAMTQIDLAHNDPRRYLEDLLRAQPQTLMGMASLFKLIIHTGLDNPAMPLIRYAIGDVGVAGTEPCSCGRGFPTMQLLQGRVDDYVILPSGRRFSPRMINPAYEELPGIVEHVLVQEMTDRFVVYLQVDAGCEETTPQLVQTILQNLFAEPIHLEVKLTQEFERGRTGKLRNIISKVKPELALR